MRRGSFHFTVKTQPITRKAYNRILDWINEDTDFSVVADRQAELAATLRNINAECKSNVGLDQMLSIRNNALKQKIINNFARVRDQAAEMLEQYNAGKSVLELSKKYNYPPLSILKNIFLHRGMNKTTVYGIFSHRDSPETILEGYDLDQFILAEKNDAESMFNQDQIKLIAQQNENKFVEHFRHKGIKLKTEKEQADEQLAEFGRIVITPDVLFIDDVFINGERVHWLDYKDYVGVPIGFLYESNKKQAAKYNMKFGPGAICYKGSYVSGMKIPGAILLDANKIMSSVI